LGVGPRPDGTIDPAHAARMLEIGDWLQLNSEAVYGTRGGPYLPGNWGVSTRKGDKVCLFVQRWKGDTVNLPALAAKVKSARLITRGTVTFEQGDSGLVVQVPEAYHRPVATIIELALDGDAMKLPVVEVPNRKNFALAKPVEVSSIWPGRSEQELNPKNATDGVPETIWAAEEKARDGWVKVDLQNEYEVCEALLSDAPYGRTQEFDFEANIDGQWKKIAAGTSIGSALHLDFPPVKARLFRLNIRKASDTPVVAEFQLFGKE
jgi:alpha-L-fucosidase